MTRRKFMPGDRVLVGKGKFGRPFTPAVVSKEWDGENLIELVLEGKTKPVLRAPSMVRHAETQPSSPLRTVRPSTTEPAPLRAVPRPPKPARSRRYLAFVKQHVCCACKRPERPVDPHHWAPHRGMSQVVSDFRAVPLCRPCHDHFHDKSNLPELDARTTRELFTAAQVELMDEFLSRAAARASERRTADAAR
jgi:hypothetical protein